MIMKNLLFLFTLCEIAFAEPSWLENIHNGKGILIAFIGMSIVFSGLVFINIIIRILLKYLDPPKSQPKATPAPVSATSDTLSDEEVLAITTAIGLSTIYIEGEKQRLTWEYEQLDQSSWSVTGRAQTLAQRTNITRLKG
jgi:Na+-transporting methylmalonyl-CoA/oxaloacetate decarboxylase gamma subunit